MCQRVTEALMRERVVPRFVDSYVIENGRHALQVHASLYRDLLTLLQRQALLALSVRTLEIVCKEPQPVGRSSRGRCCAGMPPSSAVSFASLARRQGWTAGDALDFQRDLQMYEELLARATSRESRKPFEAANHPFVDRCAFLLDSSFMEKARLAASQALTGIEELAAQIVARENPPPRSPRLH